MRATALSIQEIRKPSGPRQASVEPDASSDREQPCEVVVEFEAGGSPGFDPSVAVDVPEIDHFSCSGVDCRWSPEDTEISPPRRVTLALPPHRGVLRATGDPVKTGVTIALLLLLLPVVAGAQSVQSSSRPEPHDIEPANYAVAPRSAQGISAIVLTVGLIGGALLEITRDWTDASVAVAVSSLVFAPAVGRIIGGDLERTAWRTGTRLILGGAGILAFLDARPLSRCCSSQQVGDIVVMGVTFPTLVVHAFADVGSTRRDLALDRAIRALSVMHTPDGTGIVMRGSF